jgi:PAS domain S-box-containing protein
VQPDTHSTTGARQIAQACAAASGAISLACIVGWMLVPPLYAVSPPDYLMMAPLAAWLMVLLSGSLYLQARWPASRLSRVGILASMAAIGLLGLWVLGARLQRMDLLLEHWLTSLGAMGDSLIVGRMSPTAAAVFVLAAVALLCLVEPEGKWRSRGRQRMATGLALTILLVVGGCFLGFTAGLHLVEGGNRMPMSMSVSVAFVFAAMGIIARTMHGERWLCHISGEAWIGMDARSRRFRFRLLVMFVVLVVGIGATGSVYLRQRIAQARLAALNELAAIGRLKAEQIVAWRTERLRDARFFAHSVFVRQEVAELLSKPATTADRVEMVRWLRALQAVNQNSRLLLFDREMKLRLALPDGALEAGPVTRQHAASALEAEEPVFIDLHRSDPPAGVRLEIAFAIQPPPAHMVEKRPIAVVLLQLDPRTFLYPLIESWPTTSRTAETVLARRDGDTVVYLNDLRHLRNTALNQSFPVDHPGLPPGIFLQGNVEEQLLEGLDYRGVPVLAAFRRIAGSPWALEAKVDQEEVFMELRQQTWATVFAFILMIAVVALVVVLLWRQRLSDSLRRELGLERERKQLAERLALLMRHANDIVVMADADWRIVEANDRALQSYGYTLDELRRMKIFDLRAQETRGKFSAQMAAVQTEGSAIFETIHRRKDGSTFQVEVSSRAVEIEGARYFLAVTRDISERKRAEAALRDIEGRYRSLFQNMLNGFAYCRMIFEQGRPVDFVYIAVNSVFENLTGLKNVVGKKVSEVIPGLQEKDPEMLEIYGRVVQTGKPEKFEIYTESLKMWFAVSAYRPQEGYFVAVFDVITQRKEAERVLRESEERYRLLADNADDFVSLNDTEGNRLYLSPSYYRITGWTPEDLKATDWRTRMHPDDLPMVERTRTANLAGQITMIEYRVLCRDGSWIWVETRCKPLAGPDGKVQKMLLWSRDITGRKRTEEALRASESALRMAQRLAHVGNWEWDSASGHTVWSEEMFRIFGRDPALGAAGIEEVPKYFTPESWARVSAAVEKTLADGIPHECDAEIIRGDGVRRWVTARGEPVRGDGGKITSLHGSVQDITDRKLAADEIRRFNQTLEQRVHDRTAQLEAANRELESFCYSVSHDLRAPLRAINGFASILAQDHVQNLNDEGRRTLGIVCSEAVRMGRLIDDLLEFSRVGRQALQQVEIDMAVVAQRIFDECAQHAPGRDIRLHLHALPRAQGDPALIPHIWTNLIANAIKYTRPRPTAEIEITGRTESNELVYCVKDNGVGFDMQYADKLFGVFQRLHTENEFEGTGVGLALVQRIVLRHGGRVWAEGKVGEGAAFYFSLPGKKA